MSSVSRVTTTIAEISSMRVIWSVLEAGPADASGERTDIIRNGRKRVAVVP